MAFKDQVSSIVQEILSDSTQWPAEMSFAIPQLVAQSPVTAPVSAGDLISSGTTTSNVTTTGTTFGTGADILSTPLSFTAQGNNSYLLRVEAVGWSISVGTNWLYMHANVDGADAGLIAQQWSDTATGMHRVSVSGVIVKPATGSHTINARVRTAAGTLTVTGGTGGTGANVPILVALYRI